MRSSGSPRFAVIASHAIHTPADLNWNNRGYAVPVFPLTYSLQTYSVPVVGYGMWSVYIQVSAAGNHTLDLLIGDDVSGPDLGLGPPYFTTLCTLNLTMALTSGAVRHYTFGSPGTGTPCVAWWVKLQLTAPAAGTVTARLYGRAGA